MNIFYISKYTHPSDAGNGDRKYILAKYMNRITNKVTLIYSRSTTKKYPRTWKLAHKEMVGDLECVRLNGMSLKQMGINFRRMFTWVQFEIHLFLYFIFLPKKKRPDVVIASSFSLFTFYTASILKNIYKFQLILEVRDICPQTELDFGRVKENSLAYKMFKYVELFGYKHADKIYATMPKFDEYLKTQGFGDIPFICIPQGFDKDFFISIQEKKENDLFTVMYAGTIGEVNLVEELCIAAEHLQNESIQFLIYGNGPLKNDLQDKYKHLEKLKFMGKVSVQEIRKLMNDVDLHVNMWADKSVYDYGVSPNKWIDYMLSAKPILVSYNGYQSIINEANCGWFIDANKPALLADKILEISKMDKAELKQIGKNGRNYVLTNHDYEKLAQDLVDFIKA